MTNSAFNHIVLALVMVMLAVALFAYGPSTPETPKVRSSFGTTSGMPNVNVRIDSDTGCQYIYGARRMRPDGTQMCEESDE